MFPAATAVTFQATVDKTGWTWGDLRQRGRRDGNHGESWQDVIAVDAGPDF